MYTETICKKLARLDIVSTIWKNLDKIDVAAPEKVCVSNEITKVWTHPLSYEVTSSTFFNLRGCIKAITK